jgi:succinyl-diaminopimelate desuccinylase
MNSRTSRESRSTISRIDEDTESVLRLARDLVQIPSRAYSDDPAHILAFLRRWFESANLESHLLHDRRERPVGLYVSCRGPEPGPRLCLNACVDTAEFGDEEAWRESPTSGAVHADRLYGRGAADSKMGVAIFAHIAKRLQPRLARGVLHVVFDADEHTGGFEGVRAFLQTVDQRPDGWAIGYPNDDKLVVASRGFWRIEVITFGEASHTGSTKASKHNAIAKMARFIELLSSFPFERPDHGLFAAGPKATVTEIGGGRGFSQLPDRCTCKCDFRVTPAFGVERAAAWLDALLVRLDEDWPTTRPTRRIEIGSMPAFATDVSSRLVTTFAAAIEQINGIRIPLVASGPSNVGNLVAQHGVPVIAGYGAPGTGVHAPNEYVELGSILRIRDVYETASLDFVERSPTEGDV